MEPMETDQPPNFPADPTSKPTISPAADADADVKPDSLKRPKEDVSDEDEGTKKPAKKHKKGTLPPIVKRKTAIESSDEEDAAEASAPAAAAAKAASPGAQPVAEGPTGAHQVLTTAVKVDASLPNPDVPSPAPGANDNGHKPSAASASSDEEDVPLSQKPTHAASPKAGPSRTSPESESSPDKPLAKLPNMKRKPKAEEPAQDVKMEPDASEDDKPLKSKRSAGKNSKRKSLKEESDSDAADGNASSEYEAAEKPKKKAVAKKKAPASKKVKKEAKDESDATSALSSEDERPLKAKAADKKKAAAKPKAKKEKETSAEAQDEKKPTAAEKKKAAAAAKGKAKKEEGTDAEEEEEKYKWWEHQREDQSIKWSTLSHNGVLFPPPYEPLPANVKMKYDGKDVDLPPESEEVAGFFGKMIETDHAQDKIFRANFFRDFKIVLKKFPPRNGISITDLDKCDFRPMYTYFEEERDKTKALSAAVKKEIKKARDEAEKDYQYCILDGRKEKVGNFRVEPPGLFRGRGEHPKKGTHKFRLRPEDITINIGKDAVVPKPNVPGKWKAVQHDQKVTWLATWNENVNGNIKYVFLAANSSLKGQSDMAKFEKARKLKDYIDQIRADYTRDLKDKDMGKRQRATAMYFIDVLALRAGNEKGEDEADTVGCCSLRLEHLQLQPPNQLRFDFLGKDSIRYLNVVEVDPQVFKNIKIFKKDKEETDQIFDRLETTGLNKHLSSLMPGLSAKVFRTYNASWTMQQRLDAVTDEHASIPDKLLAYNRANREVAVLCNHQKAVSKGHSASMQKLNDKVYALKYQRMKLRHQAQDLDADAVKKKKLFSEPESDLDEDWVRSHEEELEQVEIEKAKKKFEKANEKRASEKEEPEDEDVLAQQIKDIKAKWKDIKKLTAKGKAESKGSQTVAKIEDAIRKLDDRIAAAKMTVVDRDEGSAVALGTSKINYIDPRITVAWAKKHDVPVEKLLSKVLIDKFQWAVEVEEDYRF